MNIGPMIEDQEKTLRDDIQEVYFQKTNMVVNGMRVTDPSKALAQQKLKDIAMGTKKTGTK